MIILATRLPENAHAVLAKGNCTFRLGRALGTGMNMRVERAESQSGLAEVVCALEEEIALGQIGPRERLVEEELAQRFEIKRHVARQALAELEAMGVVVRQPNRGAAVRNYSPAEVEDLYVVRTLVETCAAGLIALPAPPALLRQLTAIHERHCAAVKRGDLRRVFRENLLFHKTFFAACGNMSLVEVIEQQAMKAHAIRSYSIGNPVLLAVVCSEHATMIELLKGKDRKRLVALVKQHIQPAKTAYLQLSRHLDRPERPAARSLAAPR
jgi:DNA-binding GntR family transcriptional regulator